MQVTISKGHPEVCFTQWLYPAVKKPLEPEHIKNMKSSTVNRLIKSVTGYYL